MTCKTKTGLFHAKCHCYDQSIIETIASLIRNKTHNFIHIDFHRRVNPLKGFANVAGEKHLHEIVMLR